MKKINGLWARWNDRVSLPGILAAAFGAAMLVYGISRGEVSVVFNKAVRICMECIGIG